VPQYFSTIVIHQLNARKSERIDGALVVTLKNLTPGVTLSYADGEVEGAPCLFLPRGFGRDFNASVLLRFKNPARAQISFTTAVYQLVSGEVEAQAVRALSKPFTIAAIPDTQIYAEDNLIEFDKQIEWVMANAGSLAFVTHLGDVVDNGTDEEQWANAMRALNPLLAQDDLPFSIVR